ncbi:hypothetical protein NDU88_009529 [Pleurodeles waltl]|uniref:Uncharacterized protein n=1 Tax=Pleurodeles waltl TaxID=8319 RepID=A0AAV7QXT2_PLEWA|nr:hypothetical protein NDU88_009529 [Pleurodeles waltl]
MAQPRLAADGNKRSCSWLGHRWACACATGPTGTLYDVDFRHCQVEEPWSEAWFAAIMEARPTLRVPAALYMLQILGIPGWRKLGLVVLAPDEAQFTARMEVHPAGPRCALCGADFRCCQVEEPGACSSDP